MLEQKQKIQTEATAEKSVAEILGRGPNPEFFLETVDNGAVPTSTSSIGVLPSRAEVRQKTRSTPVSGGDLFGETSQARSGREIPATINDNARPKNAVTVNAAGMPAELTVKGKVFNIRITRATYRSLKGGNNRETKVLRGYPVTGIEIIAHSDVPLTQMLQGFVRQAPVEADNKDT
jgi:hypothetical protein